jgi:hypothetical protein
MIRNKAVLEWSGAFLQHYSIQTRRGFILHSAQLMTSEGDRRFVNCKDATVISFNVNINFYDWCRRDLYRAAFRSLDMGMLELLCHNRFQRIEADILTPASDKMRKPGS